MSDTVYVLDQVGIRLVKEKTLISDTQLKRPEQVVGFVSDMGNEGRGKKKLDVAVEFIKEFFGSASEIASNDIIEEASHRGIKRNTLLSAKKKLGIVSGKGKQEDGTAFWTWIMPEKRV